MRSPMVVVSALVLAGLVGGTALAADGTAPAQSGTATLAVHATPARHKVVRHKKRTTKKTSGAASRQAPAPGAH